MIDFSAPLAGLDTAGASVSHVASKIASVKTPGDQVELSVEMVALTHARNEFESNLKVIQAESNVTQGALNILA